MILKKSCFCLVGKSTKMIPSIYLLSIVCLFPLRAHAYLDPGTGSYIIQILIGTVLGAGYVIGVYWRKILGFFQRNKGKKEPKK